MAAATAAVGTAIVFLGAYFVEKGKGFAFLRGFVQFLAMLPLAVPGLVLGLSYIFFFNAPWNSFGFLYGTLALLVVNSIAHFFTVSHLTATTALKQLDAEFESVSASLKVPILRTFARITLPVCLPTVLDIGIYLFVNAMTTVSAVIFIYAPETKLASIALVNMEDNGNTAAAAAMGMMIVVTSATVKLLQLALARTLEHRTQAWRRR
jgi:iron(III) transport system permease protein